MRKVLDDKTATKLVCNEQPIEPRVRQKRRKKRKDLEQLRRNVLDARQNSRRERKQAGAKSKNRLKTSLNKTLESLAEIREKNENKTQGFEDNTVEKKQQKTLCTRLLRDPEIGIFRNGAKGNEVKRRTNVASEATGACVRRDVIKLLDVDDRSPKKLTKNRKKFDLKEKEKSISRPSFHVDLNKESPCRNKPRGFKRISKEKNLADKYKIEKSKKRLFENDERGDNESIDFYRMEPLQFSPKISRVDDIETDEIPENNEENIEGKSTTTTDTQSYRSLDRWRWSPVTCFEEFCASIYFNDFTDFIDNCYITDPEEKCRKSLSVLIEAARSNQSQKEPEKTLSDVQKCYSTSSFSDNETIMHKDQCRKKYEISCDDTSQPSLSSYNNADKKSDIPQPLQQQYSRNATRIVTPQKRIVEKTSRVGRVVLQQSVRIPRNSRKISTFDVRRDESGEEFEKVGMERSTRTYHEREEDRDCNGVRIQCHRVHLPNASLEMKRNRSEMNINQMHVQDEESNIYYRREPPSSIDWNNTRETKTKHYPRKNTKHVPSILRRSSNDKNLSFQLNFQNGNPASYSRHTQEQQEHLEIPKEYLKMPVDKNLIHIKKNVEMPKYNADMSQYFFTKHEKINNIESKTQRNITNNFHQDNFQDYRKKKKNSFTEKTSRYAVEHLAPVQQFFYDPNPPPMMVTDKSNVYDPRNHLSQYNCQENPEHYKSEFGINDSVLHGLQVLSFSEDQRNQAHYIKHEEELEQFPTTQPLKYLAGDRKNEKFRPQRIPIYPSTEMSSKQVQHEKTTHYNPYTRINQTQLLHPTMIHPQVHENNQHHYQYPNNYNLWSDDKFLHHQSSNQNNEIRPNEILRTIPYSQTSYDLVRGHSEPCGIKLNDRSVSFFVPRENYRENFDNQKCSGDVYCRNQDCPGCLASHKQAVRFF